MVFILAAALSVNAQIPPKPFKPDSVKQLQPVSVRAYLSEQPVLGVPASVSVINPQQLNLQPGNSFIPVLNTVPGVRAEERSPGSYRLSIRGSLLRSPFGVRDVKIYYDEIPLTDAGGNTYLNAIDFNNIRHIEILKGPDGSLFGANSGGVVLLNPHDLHADSSFTAVGITGGSYGLLHENAAVQSETGNYQLNLTQAYEGYGGYRQHSAMHRNFIQAASKWSYSGDELKILGFYSAMNYETPGGLTLNQYLADPTQARSATQTLPGAIGQKSGIDQQVLFGGIVNTVCLNNHLRNVLAVFGTYVDFSNPFITTYNQRYESTFGLRTYFEFTGTPQRNYQWKVNLGLEWQQTNADINSYGNRKGVRDTAQVLDKINTNQHFIFTRYSGDFFRRFHLEAALSLNFYDYEFMNIFPYAEAGFSNRAFTPQLMPRVALSGQITTDFIWRCSVSRGYSTPTIAEIRPTDQTINNNLRAEYGWNYETGIRIRNSDESMFLDASVFYYHLQNAIVPRFNPKETQYYVNSGGTSQPGVELYFTDWLVSQTTSGFIRGLQFNESVTLDKFTFSGTGKMLTGVPERVFVSSLQLKLPQSLFLFIEHNYTSQVPLNDANTAFAGHYNLIKAKAGWTYAIRNKNRATIYAGADNLLNEKYSLGNDLNAVGGRYYNAAALRNYYIGLSLLF